MMNGRSPITSRFLTAADLFAGLSLAGLLLPEAVAYSSLANLPPQAGIIGLGAGLLCYGLAGSSRYAIVAATSSSATVLAAAVHSLAPHNGAHDMAMAAGLVIITGIFFMLAGILRIGRMANFIAKPVLRGFAFGLALVIVIKQVAKMLGFAQNHSSIIEFVLDLLDHWPHWSRPGLATGATALALLYLFARIERLPGTLIVIVLGVAASKTLNLDAQGVVLVGPIELSLPHAKMPTLDRDDWSRLAELAVAMTLILFAESYGAIRTFALKHGDAVAINRDLVALGLANLLAGTLQGTPVGAGFSATAANEAAGAQSKTAGLYAALTVLTIAWLGLPYIAALPESVLAAVVIYALRHSLTLKPFLPYLRWRRDRFTAAAAVAAVIVFGILDGLLISIAVSLIMTLRRLAEPKLTVLGRLGQGHAFVSLAAHPDATSIPGLLILRPEEPLFFANVELMMALARQQLDATPGIHTAILSLEESPDLDGTAIEALDEFAEHLKRNGIRLLLARVKDPVRDVLMHAQLSAIGPFASASDSVDDIVAVAEKPTQERFPPLRRSNH